MVSPGVTPVGPFLPRVHTEVLLLASNEIRRAGMIVHQVMMYYEPRVEVNILADEGNCCITASGPSPLSSALLALKKVFAYVNLMEEPKKNDVLGSRPKDTLKQ